MCIIHSLEAEFEDIQPLNTVELHMAHKVRYLFVIEMMKAHGLPDFIIHGNDL